jgi:hypothetical protein
MATHSSIYHAVAPQNALFFSSIGVQAPPVGLELLLESLRVRVTPYNSTIFSLGTLASIFPHRAGGWSVVANDDATTMCVRNALLEAIRKEKDWKEMHLVVEGKKMRVVNSAARPSVALLSETHLTNKRRSVYQDNYFSKGEADSAIDALTPKANSLQTRLAKAWVPVDTKQASVAVAARRARQHARRQALETQVAAAELNLSDSLVARLERVASSNKKTMRQLLKRVTAAAFDKPPTPVWT